MAEKNTAETAAEKQSALKVHHLRPAPGAKTAKTTANGLSGLFAADLLMSPVNVCRSWLSSAGACV
jgi:hypothetical protein